MPSNSSESRTWPLVLSAAIGGYCLYRGLNTYFGGTPLTPSPVGDLVLSALFLVVPVFFLIVWLFGLKSKGPSDETLEEAPWMVRREWRTNELPESHTWPGRLLVALFVNAGALPLAGVGLYEFWMSPSWSPFSIALWILLPSTVGIGVIWWAFAEIIRLLRFGRSTLVMNTMPARLGHPLRARLRVPIPVARMPDEGVHVTLSCYRQYVDRSGRRNQRKRNLKWRDEVTLREEPVPGQPDFTEVPIAFDLPTDPPPSTPHKTTARVMWTLEASAPLPIPNPDYNAVFEIPVFEPDSAPESATSEPDPSASPKPPASHQVSPDRPSDISDGIQVEGTPGRGLTVSFAPARRRKQALSFTALAVLCLVGSLLAGFSFLGLLFGCGVAFGYGAWMKWTNSSTLSVKDGTLSLTQGPVGNVSSTQFPCSALEEVVVDTEGESFFRTANYSLTLVRSQSDSTQDVTVVDDLADKAEAEWMADQILKATEQ
jgi:hypothetical protein